MVLIALDRHRSHPGYISNLLPTSSSYQLSVCALYSLYYSVKHYMLWFKNRQPILWRTTLPSVLGKAPGTFHSKYKSIDSNKILSGYINGYVFLNVGASSLLFSLIHFWITDHCNLSCILSNILELLAWAQINCREASPLVNLLNGFSESTVEVGDVAFLNSFSLFLYILPLLR